MRLTDSLVRAPFGAPVHGFCTTRAGGVSPTPYDTLNLGASCGDDPECVAENRTRLDSLLPSSPCWLDQVHGNRVIHLDDWTAGVEADAAWTDRPGQVAAVLTADCLPILVADRDGRCVAAIHAGWRGLSADVIARSIAALPAAPETLEAWIGPRICRDHYEVGREVHDAFAATDEAFVPSGEGHWLADLARVARSRLLAAGVSRITDSKACTAEGRRFYSYRRDQGTGRMASVIWTDPHSLNVAISMYA